MEDELISVEIEKLLGKPTRMSLFDEESYNVLRQYIIDAPAYSYDRTKYPFDDNVKITLKAKKYHLNILNNVTNILFQQIIIPLLNHKILFNEDNNDSKHIFRLFIKDVCNALGYYDSTANHFYIKKGSKFAKTSIKYSAAASSATRNRMIVDSCVDMGNYYIVNDDFKCRTATSAASVVMGKVSHYSYWKDVDGKGLMDLYPTRFTSKKK